MATAAVVNDSQQPVSWVSVPSVTALACLLASAYFLLRRNPRIKSHLDKVGGPPCYPIIGGALHFLRPHNEYMSMIDGWIKEYGTVIAFWIGNFIPYVFFSEPAVIEKVLSTSNHIDKGKYDYALLYDWLGWGLLTAPRKKWFPRRKLLTPSFHFKILEDFVPVFNEQASILLECLSRDKRDVTNAETFNMYPYITKCTLDIICETAMGKKINAQTSTENKTYIDAVNGFCTLLLDKMLKPWMRIPIIYNLSSMAKQEADYLQRIKGFTEKVIQTRKAERKSRKLASDNDEGNKIQNTDGVYGKQRKAFLDLLLDTAEENKEVLSDSDIREEVDTFMFEGHDTTGVNLAWTVLMLATHPECQKMVQEELDEIFSDDPTRDVTSVDISKMKYLECCVKESLRLYPSVPFIMRQIDFDIPLQNGKIIPKGATGMVGIYHVHHNPEHFPEPFKFKPERFSLENSAKRHPYAYIPFSAGARNCIGQKFALMEEKIVLAKLFRTFTIETKENMESLRPVPDVVLRCENGVHVKLRKRN